ncbi:MAG: hypothetical protein LUI12_05215 [Clostridiales bacterium]|nr:hypothetical protein [Clostridiales bacterium]
MDPYEYLANAIIVQAAQDYRTEMRKLKKLLLQEPANAAGLQKKKTPHEKWEDKCNLCRRDISSVEDFFHSQWMETLSDADGGAIFEKLREEVAEI